MLMRRRLMMMRQEDEEVKEWKLLEIRTLEEAANTVSFELPEGVNEVSVICKTKQERSDGETITSNRTGAIYVNGNRLISGISNFSGYNTLITALAHVKNLGAYFGGSCVTATDPGISKSPVYPCNIVRDEEIKKIDFRPQYQFVSEFGDVGRFSAGSVFTVYYR